MLFLLILFRSLALQFVDSLQKIDSELLEDLNAYLKPIYSKYQSGDPKAVDTIMDCVNQVLSAIKQCHKYNILHRDIRKENFLVRKDKLIVLSDFGCSIHFPNAKFQSSVHWDIIDIGGNKEHIAPEIHNAIYQSKVEDKVIDADWSMQPTFEAGVIIYEILYKSHPLKDYPSSFMDNKGKITCSDSSIRITDNESHSYLLKPMLKFDHKQRPNIQSLYWAVVCFDMYQVKECIKKKQLFINSGEDRYISDVSVDDVPYIFKSLRINPMLTSLEVSYSKLGCEGAKRILEYLEFNTTLTNLKLRYDKLGVDGAKYISELLKSNSTLKILNIEHNRIKNEGFKYISESLLSNTSLTQLEFGLDNFKRGDSIKYLSESLKSNSALTDISLWCCDIGDAKIGYLSKSLESNSTLTKLNLEGNAIRDEGAKYISESIKLNSTLMTLNLSSNKIKGEGAMCIFESLKSNTTLTQFDLSSNRIEDEFIKFIEKSLISNTKLTLHIGGNISSTDDKDDDDDDDDGDDTDGDGDSEGDD
eukprot:TRINITY_DN2310_c0_g1_i3.p1 TRINITY_DN2310_c0_g1~~TRINITY_DN2310_c0_g1_i3.p1  ORF type:complete len:531 (-),score=91.00 TRINITY_DN2310_c0_g1_i3:94-1686(-)